MAKNTEVNDYDDILDRSWDEIPEAKQLPVGTYRLKAISGKYTPGDGNLSPRVNITLITVEPVDVDADDIAELGEDYPFSENIMNHVVWLSENRDYRNFALLLGKFGVDLDGMGIQETLRDIKNIVKNREILAYVEPDSFVAKSGEEVHGNKPTSFAPIE